MQRMSIVGKKYCVFCKHWYDPTNSALAPYNPLAKIWYIDETQVNMCLLRNTLKKSLATCSRFELKL